MHRPEVAQGDAFGAAVRCFMTDVVHTVRDSTTLVEVEATLMRHRISSAPVVDRRGRPVGVISRFDLLRVGRLRARTALGQTLLILPDQPAHRLMHRPPITVAPEDSVVEAARTMTERHLHRLFVVDREGLVGVFSTKDLMRAVAAARIDDPLSQHHRSPVLTIDATDGVAMATDRLASAHVTGLAVVENERPVGFFSQIEALEARDLPPDTPVEQVMSMALLCLPVGTALHQAAGAAAATRARRVLTIHDRVPVGILTGLDFARAVTLAAPGPALA